MPSKDEMATHMLSCPLARADDTGVGELTPENFRRASEAIVAIVYDMHMALRHGK